MAGLTRRGRNLLAPAHQEQECDGAGSSRGRQSAVTREDPESGAALITVMMFAALTSLVALSLMDRYVVEYRATDDSLAQVRAYWAARGMTSYVLSRTMASGACPGPANTACTGTSNYAGQANTYLQEIKDFQTWSYPDVSYYYNFALKPTTAADALAPSGRLGEVEIKTTFAAAPAPPPIPGAGPPPPGGIVLDALRNFSAGLVRPLDARYCVVSSQYSGCGGGGGSDTPPVWQRITSMHRPAS